MGRLQKFKKHMQLVNGNIDTPVQQKCVSRYVKRVPQAHDASALSSVVVSAKKTYFTNVL